MLTKQEPDDTMMKLQEKRPVCWSFVSERLSQQHSTKHFEIHGRFIEEILYVRYSDLYIELVSVVANDVEKDREVHLTLR